MNSLNLITQYENCIKEELDYYMGKVYPYRIEKRLSEADFIELVSGIRQRVYTRAGQMLNKKMVCRIDFDVKTRLIIDNLDNAYLGGRNVKCFNKWKDVIMGRFNKIPTGHDLQSIGKYFQKAPMEDIEKLVAGIVKSINEHSEQKVECEVKFRRIIK